MIRIEDLRDEVEVEIVPDELPEQNPALEQFSESVDAWFASDDTFSTHEGITEHGLPVRQLGLGRWSRLH